MTTEWALRSLRDPERILPNIPGLYLDRDEVIEAARMWNAESPGDQVEAVKRDVTPWERP